MDYLFLSPRSFSYTYAWGLCAVEESRPHVDLNYCRYVTLGVLWIYGLGL